MLPEIFYSSSASPSSSSSSEDAKLGILSNLLFLVGSVLQVVTAIWDLRHYWLYSNDDDDDDGDDGKAWNWTLLDYQYYYLTAAGAGMYVLNAFLDLYQARSSGGDRWEVWTALSFGLGAGLELACYVTLDDKDDPDTYVAIMIASMHLYLLSGILALWQGMNCYCWSPCTATGCSAGVLTEAGAFLFLLGCLIDVSLSWLSDPHLLALAPSTLAWGNLASALLWLLDAVLYVSADCLLHFLPGWSGQQPSPRATRGAHALIMRVLQK